MTSSKILSQLRNAHFQEVHPSRNVFSEKKKNVNGMSEFKISSDWKDLSQDWTGYQEEPTRHEAWNLNKEFCKVPVACTDVHKKKFVKGLLSNRRSIQSQTYLKVEGREVHCRQRRFPAHDWGKFSFRKKLRPHERPKTN